MRKEEFNKIQAYIETLEDMQSELADSCCWRQEYLEKIPVEKRDKMAEMRAVLNLLDSAALRISLAIDDLQGSLNV